MRAREDKSQGSYLIFRDLSVDPCGRYSVFDSLCSARYIFGELHQFSIEVRARGIDIVRGVCPLDMSGHARVVAFRLVYM